MAEYNSGGWIDGVDAAILVDTNISSHLLIFSSPLSPSSIGALNNLLTPCQIPSKTCRENHLRFLMGQCCSHLSQWLGTLVYKPCLLVLPKAHQSTPRSNLTLQLLPLPLARSRNWSSAVQWTLTCLPLTSLERRKVGATNWDSTGVSSSANCAWLQQDGSRLEHFTDTNIAINQRRKSRCWSWNIVTSW